MSGEDDNGTAVRVTLDHNCVIDLEASGGTSPSLRALVSLHNQGVCHLRVVGIGASERKSDGSYAANFAEFTEKVAAAGLHDAEILKPLGYFGITFLDWCVVADDELINLERRIHAVLFPGIEFEYASFCVRRGLDTAGSMNRKWKNAKCDVLAMWCHVWYGGDAFVTADKNFHKATKKPLLIALGAGSIMYPDEAAQALQESTEQAEAESHQQ